MPFLSITHTFADTQGDKTLLALNPETVRVQVRQETAFSRVQCVGTVITGHRTLASNLADSGHVYSPKIKLARASYGVSAPRQALQPGHRIVLVNSRLPGPNAKPEILKGGVVYADPALCSSPEQTKIPMDRVKCVKSTAFRKETYSPRPMTR